MKFSEVDNCNTCKNAYDIDIQGDHCFCIANQCYMCANNRKECKDYVRGDVPAGKERWGHLEYLRFPEEPEGSEKNMETGLFDKNGTPINIGDKTRLVLDDGEVREFDVCFKTVQRTMIKTLRGFYPESVDVSITGIFFCWNGNDLLPCVDADGVSDTEKMEVIQQQY